MPVRKQERPAGRDPSGKGNRSPGRGKPESPGAPSPPTAREIVERLRALGDPERARVLGRFFKTGPGQYGEGDVFAGLTVPAIRRLALEYRFLTFPEVIRLLGSPLHEARLLALLLLVRRYAEGDASVRERVYRAYLGHTRFVNSWDLVDVSAEHIIGAHLANGGRERLRALASSALLWERRIAVMATFHFIRRGDFSDTFHIAGMLLGDPEDLIHKAVGWMLREIGKRDRPAEESFLREHCRVMPRTMLRYAIEKFPEPLRKRYLKGDV
jgi:3-methyladenine DNA glycosylase AlkD